MSTFTIEAHDRSYVIDADPESLQGNRLRAGIPYEQELLEHLYGRGLEGVAVDVGASIGNHTLWLAVVCGLRVWAFEPLEHDALVENAARNDLLGERVVPVRHALGAAHGWAVSIGAGRLSVIPDAEGVAGRGVGVRPLDSWALEDVALLKIDVEDMEPAVLRGAKDTIERCRPSIYAEARDPAAHEAIAAELEPRGYRLVERFGVRYTPVERWEPA